ncbi:MAG TPA: reverse transcriptase/maturase family protein, partial [Planctomycetota bacterium]|nr:reverse transcriptase/maturase family protein [Planctomycetota bacterium]
MSIYRVAFRLRILRGGGRIHPHHAALLYALLSEANGLASGSDPSLPEGVLLDVVERGLVHLVDNDPFVFGCTLLCASNEQASKILGHLVKGLKLAGKRQSKKTRALDGNFVLEGVEDLVARRLLPHGDPTPQAIPHEALLSGSTAFRDRVTLLFQSPLRMMRRKSDQAEHGAWFDGRVFTPALFLNRLLLRLELLGFLPKGPRPFEVDDALPIHNRLTWVDMTYGPADRDKSHGGALGEVAFSIPEGAEEALALGQWVGVGQGTRFGFGAYRILECGPAPYSAMRGRCLLDRSLGGEISHSTGEEPGLEVGELAAAARRAINGEYLPGKPFTVQIASGSGHRTLSIPDRCDRALQRCVLRQIAPAIDMYLEHSSHAYRTGLGTWSAARALKVAHKEGFSFAIRADFRRFFDTIDHTILHDRLRAYLGDDPLVDLLMHWVRAHAPSAGLGLPTGAPLSPLLSNLFLDRFDEIVEGDRRQRRLVRYADDFLLLFRKSEQAESAWKNLYTETERIRLALNSEKTHVLDLDTPFEFLGLRFEPARGWAHASPEVGPRTLNELGWKKAPKAAPTVATAWRLPGELSGEPRCGLRSGVILPGATMISDLGEGRLRVHRSDAPP